MATKITATNLDSLMEIDHVIRVLADGTVEEPRDIYAPEVYVNCDAEGQISADDDAAMIEELRRAGWEILNGWSRQQGYSGPIMHPSEYIGGGMADHILSTPGLYVAVTVETLDDDEEAAGWAVLYRAEEEQAAPVTEQAADTAAPGQQYGGITREDVANGNGPAEALWRAGEFFKMFDEQQAARAAAAAVEEERTYTIAVTKRVVSTEAESCRYEGEADPEHECDGECTSLEGDVRELEAPSTEEVTADADDLELHDGDPVAWATEYIRTKTDATSPSASPIGDTAREHEWLSGTYTDPYDNSRETHTTVRLTGDWTEQQRAQVFTAACQY